MSIKLYPVIELLDLYYAHKYNWLSKLAEISEGIMLRPEKKLGEAFKNNKTIRQYLLDNYNIYLGKLKIMFDHGIFLSTKDFKLIFGVRKDPRTLVKIYDVLGVDYGLAYDIPARLHVEFAIRSAISEFFNNRINDKRLAVHYSMKPYLKKLIRELVSYMEDHNYSKLDIKSTRTKISKLIRSKQASDSGLYKILQKISKISVRETVKRVKKQLRFKNKINGKFTLVPVVQGLYEEHAKECLIKIVNILMEYNEIITNNNSTSIYVAIGTGGRRLSDYEAKIVNKIMMIGHNYAKANNFSIRFHILGWTSPIIARKLNLKLIYSSDSLSARVRAGEGKIYVIEGENKIRLKHVSEIKPNLWNCQCIVCRDPKLRSFVLDPSGKRRNDVRMIHNLWILKHCIANLLS